jgi:hypothetical protein
MTLERVASPGDRFQGTTLLPIQTTEHAICRSFTGATGLEPATSGVTGRSWPFREICGDYQREQGFSAMALRGLPGVCGSFRRPPAG